MSSASGDAPGRLAPRVAGPGGGGCPGPAPGVVRAVDFHAGQVGQLFLEPLPRPDPRGGERHALRAVGVAGQRAEFLQLGDGAPGIEHRGTVVRARV